VNNWKVIFATLVIFGTGVVTGGLLVSHADRVQQRRRRPSPAGQQEAGARAQTNAAGSHELGRASLPNPVPQLLRKDFLQNLDREVHLTSDQHERIEKIMSEGQEYSRQLWEHIAPEMRTEMAQVKEHILAVLTPVQRERFEALVKQRPREGRRSLPARDGSSPEGAPTLLPPAELPPPP